MDKQIIRKDLNKLTENQLDKLTEILGIGFLNEDLDKEEKIMILQTESQAKIAKAIIKLKKYKK